jgi:cyanophycinase-like exopeptidase
VAVGAVGPAAAVDPTHTLVPIGSAYEPDTLQLFAEAAAEHDSSGQVVILVLPITYSLSATSSKNGERQKNLTLADNRRGQVETACNAVKAPTQTCVAQLVPALVRADAFLASNLAFFTSDVDGMYILGGDQTVAMGVVADTPMEDRMATLYAAGAVVGGNSAGDAVQSVNMINGYTGSNGPAESMRQGAVDIWASSGVSDPSRGLIFGLSNAITDQHVFEYGRLGRSTNVAFTTGLPIVGMDAATGGVITDESELSDITGYTVSVIVDPDTYGATGGFGGPNQTLGVRRMATHLLPPGGYGYDLDTLLPSLAGVPLVAPAAPAAFPTFSTLPGTPGPLFLAGGLGSAPSGPAVSAFLDRAGGGGARIVVLAAGYPKSTDAQAAAKSIAATLQPGLFATVRWIVLDGKTDAASASAAVTGATGIYVTAPDPSRVMAGLAVKPTVLAAIQARWGSGAATLLADDAAAAAMGPWFAADPVPTDVEAAGPEDLLAGGVTVAEGLGWVNGLTVTPRLLPGQRWGQVYQLINAHPAALGVGVDVGTALEVRNGSATARGASAAVVLDGRTATFAVGTNGALAARWVVLDSYYDGQTLAP